MSSPRPVAVRLHGAPFSNPTAYSFEILQNRKRIERIQEFLKDFSKLDKNDSELLPHNLQSDDIAVVFRGGVWERCKLLRSVEGSSIESTTPIPVFLIDQGLLDVDNVFLGNLRTIPRALSQKYSPMPAPLIGLVTLADVELDSINFMGPDVLKSIASNVVAHAESATMYCESKDDFPSSNLFSGVAFKGKLLIRFKPEFWNLYCLTSPIFNMNEEISIRDFVLALKNNDVKEKKFHPIMMDSKSNMIPSGMESRSKSKKHILPGTEGEISNETDDTSETEVEGSVSFLSSSTSRSTCHIFYDKDPRGRKLKAPILDIVEDYIGLDEDIIKIINFYGESSARGMCPISWPTIELNDTVICLGSHFKNRALSYLIPVMNGIKVSLPESRYDHIPIPSCIIICPSFKTCIKLEEYCHSICSRVKVIGLYHSKEMDENTHTDILNGSEVIVATPSSLIRHLAIKVLDLNSVENIIFEDGNTLPLFKVFSREIAKLMSIWSEYDPRFIVSSHIWSEELCSFSDTFLCTENNPRPTVITDAPLEAAIYGGMNASVYYLWNVNLKINKLEEMISNQKNKDHRIVVFVSTHDFELVSESLEKLNIQLIKVNRREGNSLSKGSIMEHWIENEASLVVLLITDESLMYLIEEIHDADSIIHFNLPTHSRTVFQSRHMVMRDHFKHYKKDRRPVSSYIFLDNQNNHALKYIYQFLLRVSNNKITDIISDDTPEYQQLMSYFKNNSAPLCLNFKWTGSCLVKNICPHRHRFAPDLDQVQNPFFPNEGILYFTVGSLHKDSPLEMNIKLKKIKTESQVFDFEKVSSELVKKLQEIDIRELSLVMKPTADVVYLLKHKVNELRRIRTFCDSKGDKIQFYDLDGNDAPVHFDADQHLIYECPNTFKDEEKYPRSRGQVILFGLKPLDNDPKWCRVVRDKILDTAVSSETGCPQISGRIFLRMGYTFWLSEMQVLRESLESGIHHSNVSLLKKKILLSEECPLAVKDEMAVLVFENIAQSFKDHEQEDLKKESGNSSEAENDSDEYVNEEVLSHLQYAFFSELYEDVEISFWESPDLFYLRKIKFLDLLQSLESDIKRAVQRKIFFFQRDVKSRKGDLVLVKHKESFKRALITELGSSIRVHLVDYGNEIDVNAIDMIPSSSRVFEYFDRLPCQAIKCHLNNVSPTEVEWSEGCHEYLLDVHREDIICEVREDFSEPFGYSVALFILDKTKNEHFCLAHNLNDLGHAELIYKNRNCSKSIPYFNEEAFNSDDSSESDEAVPVKQILTSTKDQIIMTDINLVPDSRQEMQTKFPESIKWRESTSKLIFSVSLSLVLDGPISPDSLYVRIDKNSVFIRYQESECFMHETPIPLILHDLVKPSKTSIVYSKGRSFKLVLIKRFKKLWNSALISGLSFQWFQFNFDAPFEKSNVDSSPALTKKRNQIAFPEAYFDCSESDDSSDDSDSDESLD